MRDVGVVIDTRSTLNHFEGFGAQGSAKGPCCTCVMHGCGGGAGAWEDRAAPTPSAVNAPAITA